MDKVNVKNEAIEVENVETVVETADAKGQVLEVSDGTDNRIETVVVKVTKVTLIRKPDYEYLADEDRWIRKVDKNKKPVFKNRICLHFNKEVKVIDVDNDFEDTVSNALDFSRYSLQRIITSLDPEVAIKYAELCQDTDENELCLTAVMRAMQGAIISMRVITRLPGDIYFKDGEECRVRYKNYFYDIFDAELDEAVYDKFSIEVDKQIAQFRRNQELTRIDEQNAILAEIKARANVLNSSDAPF